MEKKAIEGIILPLVSPSKPITEIKKGSSQFNHFTSIVNYKTDLTLFLFFFFPHQKYPEWEVQPNPNYSLIQLYNYRITTARMRPDEFLPQPGLLSLLSLERYESEVDVYLHQIVRPDEQGL